MSTNKKDPGSDMILTLVLIAAWLLLVYQAVTRERYLYALCMSFGFALVILKKVSLLVNFYLHPCVKWGFLLIGMILLLLQIGYKDDYSYIRVANVLFILLGCWAVWPLDQKK